MKKKKFYAETPQRKPLTGNTPVFGTEEALVELILLALDTRLPVLAASAKRTATRHIVQCSSLSASPCGQEMGSNKLTRVKDAIAERHV